MTEERLYCRECRTDLKLRSGSNGIHAVCECREHPLVSRHGVLPNSWNNYQPLKEGNDD